MGQWGQFYNTAAKEVRNQISRGFCPKLISGNESIDEYRTIFIGIPNWFKILSYVLACGRLLLSWRASYSFSWAECHEAASHTDADSDGTHKCWILFGSC